MQMLVCDKSFCEFVVWTPKAFALQTIQGDDNFCTALAEKLNSFLENILLEEMLTRRLEHATTEVQLNHTKSRGLTLHM